MPDDFREKLNEIRDKVAKGDLELQVLLLICSELHRMTERMDELIRLLRVQWQK